MSYSKNTVLISSIAAPLEPLYGHTEAAAIARVLVTHVTGMPLAQVLSAPEMMLNPQEQQFVDQAVERLLNHEPLQYILGTSHFCGRDFEVTPATLIPRPETEELVQWIVDDFSGNENLSVVDMGTGSGAIAISLALRLDSPRVKAVDISAAALEVARGNAIRLCAAVQFEEEDILRLNERAADEDQKYHIIVSNPPYIAESERAAMERNVLDFEPHTALFVPDSDPLSFYREIAVYAKSQLFLYERSFLYFEINQRFAVETITMLARLGYRHIELRHDINGNPRMVKAGIHPFTRKK